MLGEPVADEAETLNEAGQFHRLGKRVPGGPTGPHRNEIEDGERRNQAVPFRSCSARIGSR